MVNERDRGPEHIARLVAPSRVGLALAIIGVMLASTACRRGAEDLPYVNMDPPTDSTDVASPADDEAETVRIGAASVYSTVVAYEKYTPLVNYLSEKLKRPVVFVQRPSYYEINTMVRSGDLACAFVCSGAYVSNSEGLEILTVPVINGEPHYYAKCIVPASSTAESLADLRDRSFGVTDPLSFTGRNYVHARMKQMGTTPDRFFGSVTQVEGHDTLIRMIAAEELEGGCVSSRVLGLVSVQDSAIADGLRVVEHSEPFGAPPVVVPQDLDDGLKQQLRQALQGIHLDPWNLEVLDSLGVDRFVPPPPGLYDSLSDLLGARAEGDGAGAP